MTEETQQEEILGKAYDLRLVRRLWNFIIPVQTAFLLEFAALAAAAGLRLGAALFDENRHRSIHRRQEISGACRPSCCCFLAALIGETVAMFAQYYFSMLVAQRCLADLRVAIFSHVQKLPMSYFDRNPVGRLVTRMTTDVDVLQEMFASGVITLASDFVMVIWIVGIMFYLDVKLALVSLALIPPMALAINFFRVKARHTYRQIRERIARINAYLGEAISGMAVIQLFAREEKTYREFEALNADHRDAYHLSNLYEAGLYSMVEAAGSVSVGLLLWYGGGEVLHGVDRHRHAGGVQGVYPPFLCAAARLQSKIHGDAVRDGVGGTHLSIARHPPRCHEPEKRRRAETVSRRSGLRQCLVSL